MRRPQTEYLCWQQAIEPAREEDLVVLDGVPLSSERGKDRTAFSIAQDIMSLIADIKKLDPIKLDAITGGVVWFISDAILLEIPSSSKDIVGRGRPILFYHKLTKKWEITKSDLAKIAKHLQCALSAVNETQLSKEIVPHIVDEIENIKKKRACSRLIVLLPIMITIVLILWFLGYMFKRDLIFLYIGMSASLLAIKIAKMNWHFSLKMKFHRNEVQRAEKVQKEEG